MTDPLIGATTAIFIVKLSTALAEPVAVAWSTKDGTAKAGIDYQAAQGTIEFMPGETEKQIQVVVYGQNVGTTGSKIFYVTLTPPTNAILGSSLVECTITVVDEDGVAVTNVVVAQGKRGLKGDPGLSAYEQAVIMGYQGTVEDWMNEIGNAAAAAERANEYAEQAQISVIEVQTVANAKIAEIQDLASTIAALSSGQEYFETEALLLASSPTVAKKAAKALDTKRVWLWKKPDANPGVWVNTGYSEFDLSVQYTNSQIAKLSAGLKLKKATVNNTLPVLVDAANKVLIGYDTVKDQIVAGGLKEQVYERLPNLKISNDSTKIAVLTDANNKILIGYDTLLDKAIIAGLDGTTSAVKAKQYTYFAQKPVAAEVNHILSYGQSLSVGATATTILSTTQPYSNTTFNSGPRQDTSATSVVPLVEQFNNPSSDAYANRGETHCSGMANYASLAMMKENGVNPSSHVIFASTAGHGGYTIDQLKKGSAWYSVLLDHVTKAKNLNVGKSHKVQCIPWIQGENNAVSGGLQTPYATYKSTLAQLQVDVDADVKSITGQATDVRFITYQMSYAAATWPDVARAQLDLARESDKFMLATPMYHFPYATDNVHLTNIGYKWMGAYFGRAYKQYMIEGRKPDFINPLFAVVSGSTVIVKFDVPTLPLVIDQTALALTVNGGFKVLDGASEIAITTVVAVDDTVRLQLASVPTSTVKVRYALDYLGAGLNITGGASGNLRDSTQDSIVINGTTYPLFHVTPHFELTATTDKGI